MHRWSFQTEVATEGVWYAEAKRDCETSVGELENVVRFGEQVFALNGRKAAVGRARLDTKLARATVSVRLVANCLGSKAVRCFVADAIDEFPSLLTNSFAYWSFACRLRAALSFRRRTRQGMRLETSLCLLAFLGLDRLDEARWCARLLEHDLTTPILESDAQAVPLSAFAPHVYARYHGRACSHTKPQDERADVYWRVLESWDDENAFKDALYALCEHHCLESSLGPNADDAQFEFQPWSAFPVEVAAVLAARRVQGLSVPAIDHVLFESPLLSTTFELPEPNDPLLPRLEGILSEFWPEYGQLPGN